MKSVLTTTAIFASALIGLHAGGTGDEVARAQDSPVLTDRFQTDVPAAAVERLQTARSYIAEKRFGAAKVFLTSLVKDYPGYYLARYNLGYAAGELTEFDSAIHEFEQALAIKAKLQENADESDDINDYTVFTNLGWYYLRNNRFFKAEKVLSRGLRHLDKMKPDSQIKLLNNLGFLYYIRGQARFARKHLNRAEVKGSATAGDLLQLVSQMEHFERELNIERVIDVAVEDSEAIARKIRWFETGNNDRFMTFWGPKEDHASIGIGHFIWYPKDAKNRFKETFPALLDLFKARDIELPRWLDEQRYCPWNTVDEFNAAQGSERMIELRALMKRTKHEQVTFMIQRLRNALPTMLRRVPDERREDIKSQFQRVLLDRNGDISSLGVYALLDYVHFKGEGTNPNERYQGVGWGLLQVLELMSGSEYGALEEFSFAAEQVLRRRIANAPKAKQKAEQGYLKGWMKRLRSYRSG